MEVINAELDSLISKNYFNLEYIGYSMFKFMKNGKYGICNSKGDIIANAKYDYISNFIDGYSIVHIGSQKVENRKGVLNLKGSEIISPDKNDFIEIRCLKGNLFACSCIDKKFVTYVYDCSGNLLWACPNGYINSIEGDTSLYEIQKYDEKQSHFYKGVVNKSGKIIIPILFDEILLFDTNLYKVKKNIEALRPEYSGGLWYENNYKTDICGLYDALGNLICDVEFHDIEKVNNTPFYIARNFSISQYETRGSLKVHELRPRSILINSVGEIIFEAKDIVVLNDFYLVFISKGKEGIIDLGGNIILPPIYDRIGKYEDGKFYVCPYTKYGSRILGNKVKYDEQEDTTVIRL